MVIIATRQAVPGDKDFLWKLKVAAMRQYVEAVYGWDDVIQYRRFEKGFCPADIHIIQANGADIGMYVCLERTEAWLLARLEILPSFQGRGIGSAVIQRIIDQISYTAKPLRLQVFKINPAQKLYKRIGFRPIGETQTHILMELSHHRRPPGSTFTIRPLTAKDSIEGLTALLHRAYAELGAMGLNYTAVNQEPHVTEARIRLGQCFLAEHEGQILGTVVVRPPELNSDCVYFRQLHVALLGQFGVEPAAQKSGIGRALCDACERWALAHGYSELALDTAAPATQLVSLYQRWGFETVGTVQWSGKVYRSVVMSKHLCASEKGTV